ncbi:MAG TPA: flagellar basal body rod C-terminal domain-containing protein [Verrucomicrobiae bacterium]|nr:flagellar basal body rod C-terminal domain-containing protein [Verrucomicrobiae bacterium]
MDVSTIALQGLQQAERQLNDAAAAAVNAGAGPSSGSGTDVVELSKAMTDLMSAQNVYEANLATLRTADQIEQRLVNVTG